MRSRCNEPAVSARCLVQLACVTTRLWTRYLRQIALVAWGRASRRDAHQTRVLLTSSEDHPHAKPNYERAGSVHSEPSSGGERSQDRAGCRRPAALANEAGGRHERASPSGRAGDHRRQASSNVTLAGRAPACPKHRFAAVIHGQPRFKPMPSELEDQPQRSSLRVLPKLAVRFDGRHRPRRRNGARSWPGSYRTTAATPGSGSGRSGGPSG
jgi:hypothetical protein